MIAVFGLRSSSNRSRAKVSPIEWLLALRRPSQPVDAYDPGLGGPGAGADVEFVVGQVGRQAIRLRQHWPLYSDVGTCGEGVQAEVRTAFLRSRSTSFRWQALSCTKTIGISCLPTL